MFVHSLLLSLSPPPCLSSPLFLSLSFNECLCVGQSGGNKNKKTVQKYVCSGKKPMTYIPEIPAIQAVQWTWQIGPNWRTSNPNEGISNQKGLSRTISDQLIDYVGYLGCLANSYNTCFSSLLHFIFVFCSLGDVSGYSETIRRQIVRQSKAVEFTGM